jgi:hypothetical protein
MRKLFCFLGLLSLLALMVLQVLGSTAENMEAQILPQTGLPPKVYLDKIPVGTLSEMTDATRAVGFPSVSWTTPIVTVAFNGGNPGVYALIEATAFEWTSNGGRLKFSFRLRDGSFRKWSDSNTSRAAEIRIGFFTDAARDGYWSTVGTYARRVNAGEATMNFGDLGATLSQYYDGKNHAEWLTSYAHTTILHEFGHAIGLNHEHFHPQCQPDLKLEEIVSYLTGPPNKWQREQAMYNMDATTYFATVSAKPAFTPKIDQSSVMLYSFPDSFYKSGKTSPCRPSGPLHYATQLSAEDRHYYASSYGSDH